MGRAATAAEYRSTSDKGKEERGFLSGGLFRFLTWFTTGILSLGDNYFIARLVSAWRFEKSFVTSWRDYLAIQIIIHITIRDRLEGLS